MSIALQLRFVCAAIAQRLRSDYEAFAKLLNSVSAEITIQMRSDCAQLSIDCVAIGSSDCAAAATITN
jgi:hypothetical protein